MEVYERTVGERYDDYFYRLFTNRTKYGLTTEAVAHLLNAACGTNYDESAFRKEYAAFERGIQYYIGLQERDVRTRILSISDMHYPFHKDISALKQFAGKIDILQLNGDLMDCTQLSKFPKIHRSSPVLEMIGCRNYLIELIQMLQPKQVIAVYGNHEIRLRDYLANTIDNDLVDLIPNTPLDYIFNDGFNHYDRSTASKTYYEPLKAVFPDIDIRYDGNWHCQIGQTVFCHPKAFSSAPMKTATNAVQFFRNEGMSFTSLVMAHTHRIGRYIVGSTDVYEQGAFCETDKMTYNDGLLVNSQRQGYIYVCQNADGKLMQNNTQLTSLN